MIEEKKIISLFVEDSGHETVIKALLDRIMQDLNIPESSVKISARSVRGGYGRVVNELKEFLRDVTKLNERLPDLLIVATDSNCVGYAERCRMLKESIGNDFTSRIVFVVPDPHVERWMLTDPHAFKIVFGIGCRPPDNKCDKDRYKTLLGDAFQETDYMPILNGFERVDEIVDAMDFSKIKDNSLKKAVQDITAFLKNWKHET